MVLVLLVVVAAGVEGLGQFLVYCIEIHRGTGCG